MNLRNLNVPIVGTSRAREEFLEQLSCFVELVIIREHWENLSPSNTMRHCQKQVEDDKEENHPQGDEGYMRAVTIDLCSVFKEIQANFLAVQ